MSAVTVYLVGDAQSPKTNQWLAMTNSTAERDRLLADAGEGATTKEVVVKPRYKRAAK